VLASVSFICNKKDKNGNDKMLPAVLSHHMNEDNKCKQCHNKYLHMVSLHTIVELMLINVY